MGEESEGRSQERAGRVPTLLLGTRRSAQPGPPSTARPTYPELGTRLECGAVITKYRYVVAADAVHARGHGACLLPEAA